MLKMLSSTVFWPPGKPDDDEEDASARSTDAGGSDEVASEDASSNVSRDSAQTLDAGCPLEDGPPVAAQELKSTERIAALPQGASPKKRTAPAHTADRQASRRAAKRYKLVDGRWVKGKVAGDGETWIGHESGQTFDSLRAAMEHERMLTAQRRATWTNLRAHVASTRSAVGAEAVATRARVSEEAMLTRNEVQSAREALTHELQEATGKILVAQREKQGNAGQLAFFSRLLGLKSVEIKELLVSHCIEPMGTKKTLAEIAATELREDDLEEFIVARKGGARRDAPGAQQPTAPSKQGTLDALFARTS